MGLSRAEAIGFVIAIIIVAIMGFIALGGPFYKETKTAVGAANTSPLHVKILTDPKIVGRYKPASVTLHVGQSVTFTNVSNAVHTVTEMQQRAFNSGDIQTNGATWVFHATRTGAFKYYCVYHPDMRGTIKVIT